VTDVTGILGQIERGDPHAAENLLALVYEELRRLAAAKLSDESPGQTLQATALVHEAYIRLVDGASQRWDNRGHFFAAAAEAMRRILVEQARRKRRVKHGGNRKRVELDEADVATSENPDQLLCLNDALAKLAQEDPAAAALVKLRYFAGLSVEEAADVSLISRATAYRHWTFARAWLLNEMKHHADD
jgi:RNA polymerase sigma factor (TIGR02999 family)